MKSEPLKKFTCDNCGQVIFIPLSSIAGSKKLGVDYTGCPGCVEVLYFKDGVLDDEDGKRDNRTT